MRLSLYPRDSTDWFLLGWIAAALLIAALESQGYDEPTEPDERPDGAILDDCDLQALAEGDTQTVQTQRGELVRLAAVEEGDESSE